MRAARQPSLRSARPSGARRLLVALGLVLMASSALLLWQHFKAAPSYRYVMGAAVPEADLGPLAAFAQNKLTVRRATVQPTDDATPLAELEIAESAAGPVLLNWRARVDDPFLTLAVPPEDVTALAQVLGRHVPSGSTVLAWWDSSRQFKLLAGVNVQFGEHLGLPLFVPARWSAQRAGVESIERSFWRGEGSADPVQEQERFRRFAQALLMPEAEGMAALQALAGGKPAVLALHLRDVILLGQMAPEQLGVAFQDFGVMTDVHGMVRRVHAWLDEHKYPAYGIVQAKGRPVRAVALTDTASGKTLGARLLPFVGNDQQDVAGATLVYQAGGFSVFEIAPAAATAAAAPEAGRSQP